MYRTFEGDHLYTGLDDAPDVQVVTKPNGNGVEMSIGYVSALAGGRRTIVFFPAVFEYRWVDDDYSSVWPHKDDYEFSLIEILDSEYIRRMVQSAPFGRSSPGYELGGVLKLEDIHHYRIGFDGHGIYDIVSTECSVEVHELSPPPA